MFYLIYIKEAHPAGGWEVERNRRENIYVKESTSLQDRSSQAGKTCELLSLSLPFLADKMDNGVSIAYGAWPDRIYVVMKDGTIGFKSDPGPGGFSIPELESYLEKAFR